MMWYWSVGILNCRDIGPRGNWTISIGYHWIMMTLTNCTIVSLSHMVTLDQYTTIIYNIESFEACYAFNNIKDYFAYATLNSLKHVSCNLFTWRTPLLPILYHLPYSFITYLSHVMCCV